jgi:SAM-dependent methyltransferase
MEIDPALNYQAINRKLWNARTPVHVGSAMYDVPGFIKNPSSLKEIETALLGDIRGKTALHLQCHFGMDTISLGQLGAHATGLDFSEAAIEQARQLARETGSEAVFVCADVYDAPRVLGRTFDLVFSSYGTIGWLPDLRAWGRVVADSLTPGGRFIFAEFHPFVWTFSNDFSRVEYSYFNRAPIVETREGTYADPHAAIGLPAVGWNHPLQDVLGALLQAGLRLSRFEEYDYSPYDCFENTVETAPGRFMIKGMEGKLPMVYALEAIKA